MLKRYVNFMVTFTTCTSVWHLHCICQSTKQILKTCMQIIISTKWQHWYLDLYMKMQHLRQNTAITSRTYHLKTDKLQENKEICPATSFLRLKHRSHDWDGRGTWLTGDVMLGLFPLPVYFDSWQNVSCEMFIFFLISPSV